MEVEEKKTKTKKNWSSRNGKDGRNVSADEAVARNWLLPAAVLLDKPESRADSMITLTPNIISFAPPGTAVAQRCDTKQRIIQTCGVTSCLFKEDTKTSFC